MRTVIVGDVHGCRAELEDLLARVGFSRGDLLVFVGDVVARGPDSKGVVELIRKLDAKVVRGNHEEKLIRWYTARRAGLVPEPLGDMHKRVARSLSREDWQFLRRTPLWLELPEHGLQVIHAGLLPGLGMEHQARRTLLSIRTVGDQGEPISRPGSNVWGLHYEGPTQIVFGHFARQRPQIHPFATGIDTACVYGGALTAMVLRDRERVPPMQDRLDCLVSVPARRRWYGREGKS